MESKMYCVSILVNRSEMKLDMCFFWSDYSPIFYSTHLHGKLFYLCMSSFKKNQQKALCIFLNILDNWVIQLYFQPVWKLAFSLFMLGQKKKKDLRFSSEVYLDFLVAYFEKRNDLLKILSHSMLTETVF